MCKNKKVFCKFDMDLQLYEVIIYYSLLTISTVAIPFLIRK